MHRHILAGFLATLGVLCLLASNLAAQEVQRPFGKLVEEWNRSIELIQQELGRGDPVDERAAQIKTRLVTIRAEAIPVRRNAEASIKTLRSRVDALGPPPSEEDPPEVADIAAQRQQLDEEIAALTGRVQQVNLILQQVEELTADINARLRGRAIAFLLTSYPLPMAPSTMLAAVPDFFDLVATLVQAPVSWWSELGPNERRAVVTRSSVALVVAVLLVLFLPVILRRKFYRDPNILKPSYTRRFSCAVAWGLAFGIIPAAIFGALFYRVASHRSPIVGEFALIVEAACTALAFFILAWALPRAALAPKLPNWQLIELPVRNARALTRRITFLAAIFSLDLFFQVWGAHWQASDEFLSIFFLVINVLEAVAIVALVQAWLWRRDEEPQAAEAGRGQEEETGERSRAQDLGTALRVTVALIAFAAVGASLIGYGNLGNYLLDNIHFSAVAFGILFLLRGLFRELIGLVLRSAFLRDGLSLRHVTRQVFKFWLRVLLDIVMVSLGALAVLSIWGIPIENLWDWTVATLSGFQVGDVTISVTDIFVGIVVFIIALFLTRLLQRALTDQILPRTRLDSGVRNSLVQGLGYLGMIVAFALAVAALGLNLTNLALIFGALSVGIGFGLQNVVNNFVSGIILLVERPIKVGDWVVVGQNEGFVKRIQLRATEIETFQRASVVIPNSEIVSNSITNWTHRDRYGRVDIPVKVAFGSDIEKVKEVLLDCVRSHEMILTWPAPFVLFRRYGQDCLEFEARGFLSNIEYIFIVQSDVLTSIDRALREAGIEVPYPQRELRFRDAEAAREALDSPAVVRAAEDAGPGPEMAAERKVGSRK